MKYFLLPLMLASLVLAGCSSNPNAIEPNDLPDFEASYKVKRLWSEGVGDGVEDSQLSLRPAVTALQVIAGDVFGDVYAVSRDKGKRQWRKKTGDRIAGGFYAGYGMVRYGTREGRAVALDAETGEELWRTQPEGAKGVGALSFIGCGMRSWWLSPSRSISSIGRLTRATPQCSYP